MYTPYVLRAALAATSLIATAAIAQLPSGGRLELLYQFEDASPSQFLGEAIAYPGDLDGDGIGDILAGASGARGPACTAVGAAVLLSGADGSVLREHEASECFARFGDELAAPGDLDGDGVGDYVISAPNAFGSAGRIFVFSGATGALGHLITGEVRDAYLGYRLLALPDVDGDGVGDFAASAPETEVADRFENGVVLVYSGATGAEILRIVGDDEFAKLGERLASPGDVDGDGIVDLAIASPEGRVGGREGILFGGHVSVVSLGTGQRLWQRAGVVEFETLGDIVEPAGDWNDDGVGDLLVTANGADVDGLEAAGLVLVLSGDDGRELFRFAGDAAGLEVGEDAIVAGDLNGDQRADLIVSRNGEPGESRQLYAVDGASGEILYTLIRDVDDSFATALAVMGDVDGDTVPDFAAGSPGFGETFEPQGDAMVFSGATGELRFRLVGQEVNQQLGSTLAAPGDIDGDGLADLHIGSPGDSAYGFPGGIVFAHSFEPQLSTTARTVSRSAGARVDYAIEMPTSAAGFEYRLLYSRSGLGPASLGGLAVPLTVDALTLRALDDDYPGFFIDPSGLLDADGDAVVGLDLAPDELPPGLVGLTLHLAAIARPVGGDWTYASVAVPLTIEP